MKRLHVLTALLFATGSLFAQQNEFANGKKHKTVADEQHLSLSAVNGLELIDVPEVKKEAAGFVEIAAVLVKPVVDGISTGLKNYMVNRASSFAGTHEARNTWTQAPKQDAVTKSTKHIIPLATYTRNVKNKDAVSAITALQFVLRPMVVEENKHYYYKLESLVSNSTSARLTKKAKYITLEIKPTIHYFDGDEKKSVELSTMKVGMVPAGDGSFTLAAEVNSDQFQFKPTYRFAEMAVVVIETNPQKKKADKRKDGVAEYNTDANKEAVVNVINLFVPEKEEAEEGGSGDTGAVADPDKK
jgi:hypothetical protein